MDEKEFQDLIKEKGLTEYKMLVQISIRCGGERPEWTSNEVESRLRRLLPKHGMMVDEIDLSWPLEEVKR